MFNPKYDGISRHVLESRLNDAEKIIEDIKGGNFAIIIRIDKINEKDWVGIPTISYNPNKHVELPPLETIESIFSETIKQLKVILESKEKSS